MQAQMMVAVIRPRFGTVAAVSDLTALPLCTNSQRMNNQLI